MKVLSYEKLQYLVEKIKEGFVQKESGKTLSTNDYTTVDKEKLAGIETGANKYVHPTKHKPSEIEETETKRFVSDTQIENWNNKIDKDGSKVLSTNDFTTTYKDKLDGLETGSQANKIESIKRNGTLLSITNKSIDINVPIKVSDLTNDKSYQTKAEVQALISQINKMTKKIVDSLPTTGEEDIFYLVPKGGTGNNVYDEYLWINGKFEKIGDTSTSVDLSSYAKKTELDSYVKSSSLVEISQAEIDTLFQ